MFLNGIINLYNENSNLPIDKLKNEWGKEHYPNLTEAELASKFYKECWSKLPKEKQNELLTKQRNQIEEDRKLMEKELIKDYSSSHHSLREYYDFAKRAHENCSKQYEEEIDPVPEITFPSATEEKKNKEIQKKALKDFAKAASDYVSEIRSSLTNNLVNPGKKFDRAVMNIAHSFDEKGNDQFEKNMALLKETDPVKRVQQAPERQRALEQSIRDCINFTKKLREPMSDEEFVSKFNNLQSFRMFQSIAELQWKNYEGICEEFDAKPSKETQEEWKKMSGEMVGTSAMINRLGYIANPLYSEITDPEKANELLVYVSEDGPKEIYEEINDNLHLGEVFGNELTQPTDLQDYRDGKNPKLQVLARTHMNKIITMNCTKNSLYSTISEAKIPSVIGGLFDMDEKNIKYTDLDGKELDLYDAYDSIRNGKSCKIYDKSNNTFVSRLDGNSLDKMWGGIKEPDRFANYHINSADPEELDNSIKGLNNEIKDATHWYMSSSKEFTDLRKAMEEFGKSDFFDKDKVKESMINISKLANAYIKLKEQDGTEITENTEKRLAIAKKIAGNFERSATEANLVREKDLNNEQPEREQIEIEEANDNLKQEKQETIESPSRENVAENVME